MATTMTDQELLQAYKSIIAIEKKKVIRSKKMADSYWRRYQANVEWLKKYEDKAKALESKMNEGK